MDGVVADFVRAIHGVHRKPWVYNKPGSKNKFETEKLWGMTPEEFWKYDGHDFWRNIPKTQEADQLVALVKEKFSPGNVCFLTSPSNSPGCYTGKLEWIKFHFPGIPVIFAKSHTKRFLSGPGRLLIDDRNENRSEWEENGGTGILMPRPWNERYEDENMSLIRVVQELESI